MFNDMILRDIAEVLTVHAPKGRRLQMIDRRFFGLSFCTSGKITYRHSDRVTISDASCAVLLPMGATYELYNNEGGDFPLINFYCECADIGDQFVTIPLADIAPYLESFTRLKTLFHTGGSRLQCLSLLYGIFARLSQEGHSHSGMLETVINYIREHLDDPTLNNARLALVANISEVYLRRVFKAAYTVAPHAYVLQLRIERAKVHLAEGQASIDTVSQLCGFSSVYHFSRAFKVRVGMTPTAYRAAFYNGRI